MLETEDALRLQRIGLHNQKESSSERPTALFTTERKPQDFKSKKAIEVKEFRRSTD